MKNMVFKVKIEASSLSELSVEAVDTLSFEVMRAMEKVLLSKLAEHDIVPEISTIKDVTAEATYDITEDDCDFECDDCEDKDYCLMMEDNDEDEDEDEEFDEYLMLEQTMKEYCVEDIMEELGEKENVEVSFNFHDFNCHMDIYTVMVNTDTDEK